MTFFWTVFPVTQRTYSATEICERLGVATPPALEGRQFTGLSTLERAEEEHVSFVQKEKFVSAAGKSRAGLLLVPAKLNISHPSAVPVENVMKGLLTLLAFFHPDPERTAHVAPSAWVDPTAEIGEDVHIGNFVSIGAGAKIGAGTRIEDSTVIGENVTLGERCWISSRVAVQDRCVLGNRVRLHSGAVIGADGFRFELMEGRLQKIPQVGIVAIEDDVEIGANSTIDRAFLTETRIGARTKIDNLVHIAHNVVVGSDCVIVAQVGIAGSARLGRGVMIGGQTGIKDHIVIGDGCRIAGHSAVQQSLPPGSEVIGFPATDIMNFARLNKFFRHFDRYWSGIKKLDSK